MIEGLPEFLGGYLGEGLFRRFARAYKISPVLVYLAVLVLLNLLMHVIFGLKLLWGDFHVISSSYWTDYFSWSFFPWLQAVLSVPAGLGGLGYWIYRREFEREQSQVADRSDH